MLNARVGCFTSAKYEVNAPFSRQQPPLSQRDVCKVDTHPPRPQRSGCVARLNAEHRADADPTACRALTCFEEDDLIVLTEVHEAVDALGKLHHVLDGVGDLNGALLPHRLS